MANQQVLRTLIRSASYFRGAPRFPRRHLLRRLPRGTLLACLGSHQVISIKKLIEQTAPCPEPCGLSGGRIGYASVTHLFCVFFYARFTHAHGWRHVVSFHEATRLPVNHPKSPLQEQSPNEYFQFTQSPKLMKTNNQKKQFSGFTLVELLVVIAIVATLATIAFFSAARVKDSANKAACTNNLKQIAVGLASHQADFGRFPSKTEGSWDRKILPYLGLTGNRPITGPLTKSSWPELQGIAEYFTCPSDEVPRAADQYPRTYSIVPWTTNLAVGGPSRRWTNLPKNVGVPLSIVSDPARAAVVVEAHVASNIIGSGANRYHDNGVPSGAGDTLHRTNQIVLFADGHTEVVPIMTNALFIEKYWPVPTP